MNGLQIVIVAQRYGFVMSTEGQSFVQILNIRNNHWITLSNAKCSVGNSIIQCKELIWNQQNTSQSDKSKFREREKIPRNRE